MEKIQLKYITDYQKERSKLLRMYEKFYGSDAEMRLDNRLLWYFSRVGYHLLVAEYKGEYVGQAASYKITVFVDSVPTDFHWGIDTFVLSNMRGYGIGRKLQKKLHEDLPNFSSLWYSPANGHIKKKCGANEIASIPFGYFPFTKYYSLIIERLIRKIFRINFVVNHSIALYSFLNGFNKKPKYIYKDIVFSDDVIDTIMNWHNKSDYDFYCIRDKAFIEWKYINNPNLQYNLLSIADIKGNMCAYVAFSKIFKSEMCGGTVNISNVLDYFIKPHSLFSLKDVIHIIYSFYKNKGMYLDGVNALGRAKYKCARYYEKNFLSTIECLKISKPYVTFIDQDMEQMC